MTVTNDVAKDDMRDATLRQKRQRRDVFVAVGLPAAPVGELLQSSRAACAATIAGREPSSLNIVTIVTMSKLSDARSMAKQQSLPLLHEIGAFSFVMGDFSWPHNNARVHHIAKLLRNSGRASPATV